MRIKDGHKLRSLVPQAARERLYEWHPGRARRWRRYPGVERLGKGQHAVLTFDDGPDEDATPAVLDALDYAGARATFFLLGTQVVAHPKIAQEIVDRGHEVGLHGNEHLRHDRIDPDQSREDITLGFATIEETLSVRCRWYRPPYGKMSPEALATSRALGMTTVYWSAWGLDWEEVGPGRIAEVTGGKLHDGAIVLLHDSARYAHRRSAQPTAQAIPAIADHARVMGLSLVTVGDAVPPPAEIAPCG